MQSHLPLGMRVEKGTTQQQAISGVETRATAFIGACHRGPVNSPSLIRSFQQFEKIFGPLSNDLPLTHAVRLYFLNGGATAWVVRIANHATSAGIELAAESQVLRLWALYPGDADFLRAAIDYDGVEGQDVDCFNVTVQRLAQPETETVIDQEIFRNVSIDPVHPRFIRQELATSLLVRVDQEVPTIRPSTTLSHASGKAEFFQCINIPGSSGSCVNMSAVLGSSESGTGLFALTEQYDFGQLYIPPLTLETDVAVPVLRAAARICARRNAVLIADAPKSWVSVDVAEAAIERFSLRGDNIAMYYPRILIEQIPSTDLLSLPAGGAVAGALDRCMQQAGPGGTPAGQKMTLRGIRRFITHISEKESYRLTRKGLNSLRDSRGGRKVIWDAVLLTRERDASTVNSSLKTLRILHYIAKSVEHGLQWVAFEPTCDSLWLKVQDQVHDFMQECSRRRLLPRSMPGDAFMVRCDLSTNPAQLRNQCKLAVQIDVATSQASHFVRLKLQLPTAETRLHG